MSTAIIERIIERVAQSIRHEPRSKIINPTNIITANCAPDQHENFFFDAAEIFKVNHERDAETKQHDADRKEQQPAFHLHAGVKPLE